jgi:hypothetical protein
MSVRQTRTCDIPKIFGLIEHSRVADRFTFTRIPYPNSGKDEELRRGIWSGQKGPCHNNAGVIPVILSRFPG